MENMKVNILGTEYTICEKTEEQNCTLKSVKVIVIRLQKKSLY